MKVFRNHFSTFWSALSGFKKGAVVFLTVTGITAALEGIGLSMIVPIIDSVLNGQSESTFAKWISANFGAVESTTLVYSCAILLGSVLFLKEVVTIWQDYFSIKFVTRIRNHWRARLSEEILFSEEGSLSETRQGAIIDLIVNQTQSANKFIKVALVATNDALYSVVMLGILMYMSWWVTLVLICLFGILVGASHLKLREISRRLGRMMVKASLDFSSGTSELLSGLREIKVLSKEAEVIDDLGQLNTLQMKLSVQSAILNRLPSSIGSLLVATLVLGAVAIAAKMSQAELMAVLPIAALFVVVGQRLNVHISGLVSKWILLRTTFPAFKLVVNTVSELHEHRSHDPGKTIEEITGDIRFSEVGFSYVNGGKLFDGLDLTFERGKTTILCGPSGSGKSTVADLLLALRRPQFGRIAVNGNDLAEIDPIAWRQLCAYVPQRPFLFNRSVAENIHLGRADADLDEIITAAKQAHAHEFIRGLEQGYETLVGEAGSRLSGGQVQRITIARALLRDPDLIVFDEPTSALDASGREFLMTTIRELAERGKIVVIVTHDETLIDSGDVRFVFSRPAEADGITTISRQSALQPKDSINEERAFSLK